MNRLIGIILLVMVAISTGPAPASDVSKIKDADFAPMGLAANRNPDVLVPPTHVSPAAKESFDVKKTHRHPKLILALGGGAFKSLAEIGVLNCLEKNGIQIDGIVGTSLGATIGALYCSGKTPDEIEALFVQETVQDAMFKGVILRKLLKPIAPIKHLVFGKPFAGLSPGKGYLKLLRKELPANFAQLKKPFAAVVTNLTDGKTSVLSHGDLPLSVLASNTVPTIFRPVEIDGKLYVDGGLRANLPNNIAEKLGADLTVSVLCDKAIKPVDNDSFKSMRSVVLRVADIMMAAADHPNAEASDVLIFPNVDFVPPITKDEEIIRKAIAAGYSATEQVLPQIKAALLALDEDYGAKQTAIKNASKI